LVPKPPKRDFQKLLDNDRKILRFSAVLDSRKPEDKLRKFVLAYYLADDTIAVFEPPQRNTGILGGKFLERRRLKKPQAKAAPMLTLAQLTRRPNTAPAAFSHSWSPTSSNGSSRASTPSGPLPPLSTGSPPPNFPKSPSNGSTSSDDYYTPSDLHVGAVVQVYNHRLILQDASEYAHQYMEAAPDDFPLADVSRISEKIAEGMGDKGDEVAHRFAELDPHANGFVDLANFRTVMRDLFPELTEQVC
jgi:hypothetical protein